VAITIPLRAKDGPRARLKPSDGRLAGPGRIGRVALSLGLGLWFLLPLLPVVLWTFADRWSYPHVLPTAWGSAGAQAAIEQGALGAFCTSFILGAAVGAISTPLGALAARALAFHRVPGVNWLTGLLFAPIALPAFAVVLGLNVVLLRLQVPSLLGVVLVLVVYALPPTVHTTPVSRMKPGC
jgi:putative spermidine/putrescine transport system permease protein